MSLSPLIVLLIPAIPYAVGEIYKWLPAARPYIYKFNTKMLYYPEYLIDISYGGALLLLLHLVFMIAVGVSCFNSQRSRGGSYWSSTSISSGQVALMNYWLVVIPSSKTSSVWSSSNEARLSYTRMIKYHQIIGFLAVATSLIHLSVNTVKNSNILFSSSLQFDVYPVYGFVAFIMTCFMAWTAIEPFRHLQYEVFQRVHHLSLLVVIFIILHTPDAILGFLPGIILHGFDVMAKIYSYYSPKKLAMISYTKGSPRILALRVPIDRYAAEAPGLGSFYYIYMPDISLTEWHPFSVSSYDEPSYTVTFHIKVMGSGSFTHRLYDYAKKVSSNSSDASALHSHRVSILGPYGNLSVNLEEYRHIILIAGGIGVTPMWLILDDIIRYVNADRHKPPPLPRDADPSSSSTALWFKKRASQPSMYSSLARVTLIWSYRGEETKRLFSHHVPTDSTFPDLGRPIPGYSARQDISFEYRFYDTNSKTDAVADEVNTAIYRTDYAFVTTIVGQDYGRPNIPDIVQTYQGQRFGKTCIVACGPYGLAASAREIATELGIDTHVENFEL
jgi:predicted ferric reductase